QAIGPHAALRALGIAHRFPVRPSRDACRCRLHSSSASDDYRPCGGSPMTRFSRRTLLAAGAAAAGGSVVAAAATLGRRFGLVPPDACGFYGPGETLTYAAHRLIGRHAMAREFPRHMISAKPFANSVRRRDEAFRRHQAAGFTTWRLAVDGLIARPVSLSLSELRAMPVSRQITELSCEEGWSYIAEWIGTPLPSVLEIVSVSSNARYVVY